MGGWVSEDDVYVKAPPTEVYRVLADLPGYPGWWKGARVGRQGELFLLSLPVPTFLPRRISFLARVHGVREGTGFLWEITSSHLSGEGEFWLERYRSGTICHYILRVERARNPRELVRHRWAVRGGLNSLKDLLEGRAEGVESLGVGHGPKD